MNRPWVNRAPRYQLRDTDQTYMDVVFPTDSSRLRQALIINLSETGALIRVSEVFPLKIGDPVIFEFRVPGNEQPVVWKGDIRRVDVSNGAMDLALEFKELPPIFEQRLKMGLIERFQVAEWLEKFRWKGFTTLPRIRFQKAHSPVLILILILSILVLFLVLNPPNYFKNERIQNVIEDFRFEKKIEEVLKKNQSN